MDNPPAPVFEELEDTCAVAQTDYFTAADVVSFPVTRSPTPSNSLHGSDGCSHGSGVSSSECTSPLSGDIEPLSPVEELLHLIDWKDCSRNASRRIRGLRKEPPQKRVQAEKKRRDNLATAIEDIDSLVPATGESSKRTKVAALQDAKEYFKRVQDAVVMLVQENRRLHAAIQSQSAAPAATRAPTQTRTSLQGQEVVRLLVMSTFLLWLMVGVPTPWSSSSSSVSFSSRSVLETDTAPTPVSTLVSTVAATLFTWATKAMVVLVAFSVVWICTLLQDMPNVNGEQLRSAQEHIKIVEMAMERQSNRRLAHTKTLEALAALGKSPPTSKTGSALLLMVQIIRAALNVMRVGLWLERLLVYICGRQEATLVEARAYMFAAEQQSVLQFVGFTLASASSLLVANAGTPARDELAFRMGIFYAQAGAENNCMTFRVLLMLAEKLLAPESPATAPGDFGDWTAFRAMVGHGDKLEEGVDQMMQLLPLLKGPPQSAAMACAGLGLFCMRRFREAFLCLSSALTVQRDENDRAVSTMAIRIMTCLLIICLYKLNRKEHAEVLLPHFNRLFMCVPDARVNLLHFERFSQSVVKVALASDYAVVVSEVRDLLSLSPYLGCERCLDGPFLIEVSLERLFEAIALANDVATRSPTNDAELYVLHHRTEMFEMASKMVACIERYTKRAAYVLPLHERLQGWLSALIRDSASASYHLNRSLLEARRLSLSLHEQRVLELMAALKVPLLSAAVTSTPFTTAPRVDV